MQAGKHESARARFISETKPEIGLKVRELALSECCPNLPKLARKIRLRMFDVKGY